jgi:hypothetical protein
MHIKTTEQNNSNQAPSKSRKQELPPAALPTIDIAIDTFAPVQATPRPLKPTHHPSPNSHSIHPSSPSYPITHASSPIPSITPRNIPAVISKILRRQCIAYPASNKNSNNTPRYKSNDPNLTQASKNRTKMRISKSNNKRQGIKSQTD